MSDLEPEAGNSPLALIAVVCGVLGLVLTLMGCLFSPFAFIGMLLSTVAIVTGVTEFRRVSAGASGSANGPVALVGASLGGSGCLLGGCFTTAVVGFIGVYIMALCGAIIGSGLQ